MQPRNTLEHLLRPGTNNPVPPTAGMIHYNVHNLLPTQGRRPVKPRLEWIPVRFYLPFLKGQIIQGSAGINSDSAENEKSSFFHLIGIGQSLFQCILIFSRST